MPSAPETVVITGIGMRTAVGNDAVQTAAAVRASITRFARWEAIGTAFEEEAGVVAASVPERLGDLPWTEKAGDLVAQPLHEALWDAELYDLVAVRGRARVGAYIATPYADRAGVSEDAFRLFAIEAREHCVAPAKVDRVMLFSADHAAGLTALERAVTDLRNGQLDVAIVGGVDSHLHGEHLRALSGEERLKTADRPDGLVPGEGAAIVVLERARDANARGVKPLARVAAVALDREAIPLGREHPIRAEGLSRAVAKALEDGAAAEIHRVIADLSGERWRSLEWALMETRVLGELPHGWQLWHPADCFGDMGAASSVAHLCLAVRAFARGYGGAGSIMIVAASARGERGAACVLPAEGVA
jgi:3-oxoacyl-[acyl-carrier-protein] synthase I